MLYIRKAIVVTRKDVILDSGFCVAKGITELEEKGFMVYIINMLCYWPKVITENLFNAQFQQKEVGDADILESITQENNQLQIFL